MTYLNMPELVTLIEGVGNPDLDAARIVTELQSGIDEFSGLPIWGMIKCDVIPASDGSVLLHLRAPGGHLVALNFKIGFSMCAVVSPKVTNDFLRDHFIGDRANLTTHPSDYRNVIRFLVHLASAELTGKQRAAILAGRFPLIGKKGKGKGARGVGGSGRKGKRKMGKSPHPQEIQGQ